MTQLSSSRENFIIKKRMEALTKVNSFSEDFKKRELEMKADLDEAGKILKELGKRFKWWRSLP